MSANSGLLGTAFFVGCAILYKKVLIPYADRSSARMGAAINVAVQDAKRLNEQTAAVIVDRAARNNHPTTV